MLWEIAQGSVRILAIEDGGHMADPAVVFPTADPAEFDGDVRLSFGCFLIETSEGLALVDVGYGRDIATREGVVTGQLLDARPVLFEFPDLFLELGVHAAQLFDLGFQPLFSWTRWLMTEDSRRR